MAKKQDKDQREGLEGESTEPSGSSPNKEAH